MKNEINISAKDEMEVEYHENIFRRTELMVWCILAFLVSGRFWLQVIAEGGISPDALRFMYLDVLAGILCSIFPMLYRLIFGLLPLEHLRLNQLTAPQKKERIISAPSEYKTEYKTEYKNISARMSILAGPRIHHDSKPQEILVALIESSKGLSDRIFTRAGVYLIVGVLIAFSGLGFFYLQTVGLRDLSSSDIPKTAVSLAAHQLGSLAPRFGILFFIEFIAFFFLRQYKSAMEEFRYFEAVQRKREESFALVRFMKEEDGKVDITRLLEAESFFSNPGRLAPGESTELLESKKLTKDEMDVFVKIVETVSQSKK
ncbi:MAG: hypothetical protein HY885_05285 [Deltaproteobacteria bacterium]|nr:hypothetical protein [Deltaproteobacteria bacterium]